MTVERKIKRSDGSELILSSDDLSAGDLALAEILLEISKEQGHETISVNDDELARRLVKKGYDPATDQPLH